MVFLVADGSVFALQTELQVERLLRVLVHPILDLIEWNPGEPEGHVEIQESEWDILRKHHDEGAQVPGELGEAGSLLIEGRLAVRFAGGTVKEPDTGHKHPTEAKMGHE
ncbi:MAG: hypothetical protein Kow0099_09720 [Candidatus Abyssubacteria bacterium]